MSNTIEAAEMIEKNNDDLRELHAKQIAIRDRLAENNNDVTSLDESILALGNIITQNEFTAKAIRKQL